MKLPLEVPVMTLPNATLFPQALLPLYIFEPRYRKMLADALESHRMFIVAMQKPGWKRESPSPVAGLGLIRVSVGHADGTSHLVLQGLTRVGLEKPVRYRPYRVQRIHPMKTSPAHNAVAVDALQSRIRELLADRISLGIPFPFPVLSQGDADKPDKDAKSSLGLGEDVMKYIEKVDDPAQFADLISCAVLTGARERQSMLETLDVENRLRQLIHFLMAEIEAHRKN